MDSCEVVITEAYSVKTHTEENLRPLVEDNKCETGHESFLFDGR